MKMMSIILLLVSFPTIMGHSWMTCPKSFITTGGRGGIQHSACEKGSANAHVTEVWAGDRLKVGWTSNNHAGGFVRLSLVKYGQHEGDSAEENFQQNVLKFACYGHDGDKGPNNGDCIHPCRARPGCKYQSDLYDIERYDTTIKIPTNLDDGYYVLQAAMSVGNSVKPYNSCGKLKVIKGNPNLNCQSNKAMVAYSCAITGGPQITESKLYTEAKRGDFCYRFDGTIGDIDDDLTTPPINIECDPRLTCDNSVDANKCKKDQTMMDLDITGRDWPSCSALYSVPPSPPKCDDGERNGDEIGVDCGGSRCEPCPTEPSKVIPGKYFSEIRQDNKYYPDGSGANFNVIVTIVKDVVHFDQCWRLILQYENPVEIVSSWGAGQLVYQNQQKTIFQFERFEWSQELKAGSEIKVSFSANNPKFSITEEEGKIVWDESTTRLQSATKLEVFDDPSECILQFTKPTTATP